jgi:hypothetical protein
MNVASEVLTSSSDIVPNAEARSYSIASTQPQGTSYRLKQSDHDTFALAAYCISSFLRRLYRHCDSLRLAVNSRATRLREMAVDRHPILACNEKLLQPRIRGLLRLLGLALQ